MDFTWYTNIGGIVVATILLVEVLKRFCGNWAWFGTVPTWLYAVAVSVGLTALCHFVFQTLPGEHLPLFTQAVMMAAGASGFKEWISNANKPLSASSAARTQKEGL